MATLSENIEKAIYFIKQYCEIINRTAVNVVLPDGLTAVGANSFNTCRTLKSVVIPSGCSAINGAAFASCTALQSVTIPASVTSIGNNAFMSCTALTTVYYGGSKEQWNKITVGTGNEYLENVTIIFNSASFNSV